LTLIPAGLVLGDWLGFAGLAIGVVGFALAFVQLRLARTEISKGVTAAEAARDAIVATERQAVLIELLTSIPRMQRLERDLGSAVRDEIRDAVAQHLQDWRVLAAEMRGMIGEQTYATQSLESRLHESATAAAQALDLLDDNDMTVATKRVITAISGACEEAGVLMGQLRSHPGGGSA
jgi:hypothetical protein